MGVQRFRTRTPTKDPLVLLAPQDPNPTVSQPLQPELQTKSLQILVPHHRALCHQRPFLKDAIDRHKKENCQPSRSAHLTSVHCIVQRSKSIGCCIVRLLVTERSVPPAAMTECDCRALSHQPTRYPHNYHNLLSEPGDRDLLDLNGRVHLHCQVALEHRAVIAGNLLLIILPPTIMPISLQQVDDPVVSSQDRMDCIQRKVVLERLALNGRSLRMKGPVRQTKKMEVGLGWPYEMQSRGRLISPMTTAPRPILATTHILRVYFRPSHILIRMEGNLIGIMVL